MSVNRSREILGPAFLVSLCALAGASVIGCQHADTARLHHEARLESLDQTLRIWGRSEAERPEKLAAILAHADWYFRHQAERFDANLEGAGRWIERDLKRPEERLPPMGERAWRAFYGKPDRIEPIAIELFF